MTENYRKDPNKPHALDGRARVTWNWTESAEGFIVSHLLKASEIESESFTDNVLALPKIAREASFAFRPRLAALVGAAIGQTVQLKVAGTSDTYIEFTNVSEQAHTYNFLGRLGIFQAEQYDWLHVRFIVEDGNCSVVDLQLVEDPNKATKTQLETTEESDRGSIENITWYLIHTAISRLLKESYEIRDLDETDAALGSIAVCARDGDPEQITLISWQWGDHGQLFAGCFAGGEFPEVLSEGQRDALLRLGWNLSTNPLEEPTNMTIEPDRINLDDLADKFVITLREIFKVQITWVWKFLNHDIAATVFEPSCDDVLVLNAKQRSRSIHSVVDEGVCFAEDFEIPAWIQPWK